MKAAVVFGQIDITRHRRQARDTGLVHDLKELLKLPRMPMQAIQVPHHNRVNQTSTNILDQAPVLRAVLAAPSADVVIDVPIDDSPTTGSGETLAIVNLTARTSPVPLTIGRDTGIDSGANHSRDV